MNLLERRRELLNSEKIYKYNTCLLCHAEDFTDSSNYAHTITNNNGVTLNTNHKKLGTVLFIFPALIIYMLLQAKHLILKMEIGHLMPGCA